MITFSSFTATQHWRKLLLMLSSITEDPGEVGTAKL